MGLRTIKLALGPAVALGILLGAEPARATFPGKNGRLAYDENSHHIHLSGTQLVPHGLLEYDWSPTVSPDGTKVAYIRQSVPDFNQYFYRVMVVPIEGGVPLEVASSSNFGTPTWFGHIGGTAWTADGQRVSFIVGGDAAQPGVWTVEATGSGLTRTVAGPVGGLSWSPVTDELVYTCTFRTDEFNLEIYDLCVFHPNTGITRQLRIDYPGRDRQLAHPKWTASGETIVFTMGHATMEGNTHVGRWDVFSIEAAGGGLAKLSDSGPAVCPRPWLPGLLYADSTYVWSAAAPSPSGDMIAIHGWKQVPWQPDCTPFENDPDKYIRQIDTGIYRLMPNGKPGTLLQAGGSPNGGFDWEPVLVPLTINIDDGHGHPLKGLKVELKQGEDTYFPTANEGGNYFFETLAPGNYVLRATLVDNEPATGQPPSFRIHHDVTAVEPVWIERTVKVPLAAEVVVHMSYADSSAITASNVAPQFRERLDDMAAIYWRTRQFVDWVKATLTTDTGPTVKIRAFASVFPDTMGDPVPPDWASYSGIDNSRILLGTEFSRYEVRHGTTNEAPENGEWHEFTHHLFDTHIWGNTCNGENHGGWRNADTCDSVYEGFAMFLPALASHDIDGTSDSQYGDFRDLEENTKAWKSDRRGSQVLWREDLAVASLFWDLVDTAVDSYPTTVVGADGQHHLAIYTDGQAFTLTEIWSIMANSVPLARPHNIRELRTALGSPAITVDLDFDLVPDVAELDEVFLMHGFFPTDVEESIAGHKGTHYDVAAVQRESPSLPRNDDVGYTDHRTYRNGTVVDVFIPRLKTPAIPGANLAFDVLDASGTPLAGATVELNVHDPGAVEPRVITSQLDTGSDALVPLELLPYYDGPLPIDASLPPCDPQTDVQVDVTVRTILNGYVSADTASFDNCQYLQAVATTTGPAALEFTASFPEDSTAPTSTIVTGPTGPLAPGGATFGAWRVRVYCADPVVGDFASGCWRTEYRIDGGPLVPYVKFFEITEPGSHVVEIRSVDGAGNAESFQTVTLDVAAAVDTDGDGLEDGVELVLGTSPNDADSDDDGLEDGDEFTRGTNPLSADSDLDGLNDGAEIQLGTNPLDDDTDDDGLRDGEELTLGLNPLDPDVDDDGALDGPDKCRTVYNPAQRDTDGDGLGEVCDNCPFVQNFNQQDSDGDGAGNVCDCAPSDPARRAPASPNLLAGKTGGSTIELSWPAVAGANTYSVTRGTRADLVAGRFGTCVGHSGAATLSDAEVPAPGALFTYLVQGQSFTCGSGSLGFGVNETLRVNLDPEACGPAVFVERLTVSETHVSGIVIAGTHLDTHTANNQGQSIGEQQSSGGSPSTRFGFMEHRWVFDVAPGEVIELLVQGERSDPSDGDDVRFEWSTDGTTFTPIPMASLPFIPDGTVVSGPLPATLSGPVTIRVVDTVRTPGTDAFDFVWIDRMVVRSITF